MESVVGDTLSLLLTEDRQETPIGIFSKHNFGVHLDAIHALLDGAIRWHETVSEPSTNIRARARGSRNTLEANHLRVTYSEILLMNDVEVISTTIWLCRTFPLCIA